MNALTLFDLGTTDLGHPAKYSDALLLPMVRFLRGRTRILDPFGGTGKVFTLQHWLPTAEIQAVEIEHEWAAKHPRTTVGNALALPWQDDYFDAICTSPCLTPDQRLLTADLRWVPCGDIRVGDRLVAFDEFAPGIKANGQPHRRRWRIATVEESYPAKKECVRVNLENGESITCTHDHPWLANRYAHKTQAFEWTKAEDLMSLYDPHVCKQLDTWEPDRSYEAGWLAGMFDGEGSLAFGVHGSPKLMITQVEGEIINLVQTRLTELGIEYNSIPRRDTPDHRQSMLNVYVTGGFPGILKALGRLRPTRLIGKLDYLDMASRTIQPERVRVVSVERIGVRDIQGIQTSTHTYIGEGYLMHNTYGNRMADTAVESSRGNGWQTYSYQLRRKLHPDNSGQLQWGEEYRQFHGLAWTEARRVLIEGGYFVLNIKDHIRDGERVDVTGWHIKCLEGLGFERWGTVHVPTPSMTFGQNREARVPYESLIHFVLKEKL